MSSLLRLVAQCGFLLAVSMPIAANAAFPTTYLKPVVLKQLHSPTTITYAPDGSGRLFICDQMGKIYIFQGGMLLPTPFLNIASPSNLPSNGVPNNGPGPVVTVNAGYSERGLLGLTFHPGYANPLSPGYRKFYVNYNKNYVPGSPDFDPPPPVADHTPNCTTVIAEYQVSANNPNVADPLSERRLLRYSQPQSNHNGGQVEFGPDGFLYIGVGDGGSQDDNNVGHTGGSGARPTNGLGNAQDKTRYLGKILRIDPTDPDGAGPLTYTIPPSNPFFNDTTPDLKKEIYSYGMRNPWRFSFDKRPGGSNRLFCGDVGGGRVEEVDIIVSGGNYGWRYKEGFEFPLFSSGAASPNNMTISPADIAALVDPIAVYAHPGQTVGSPALPQLGLSITGGFIYRGAAIPALQGKYVFGDYGAVASLTDGRMMGLEETAPLSGVFTLTQAIPLLHTASASINSNPIVGQRILTLGEDESGEIYIALKSTQGVLQLDNGFPSGGIYKLVPLTTGALTVTASKDNSMYSEYTDNASGAGVTLFAGVTANDTLRRALIAFDLSMLPSGATVSSAQVDLRFALGQGSNNLMTLHRVTQSWGEGTSNSGEAGGTGVFASVGDATWNYRFYNTSSWTNPGGDYVATASATTSVNSNAAYAWTSAQLAADVQGWVTSPATNNGWILIGDENGTLNAKRVWSREATTAANRPKLTVNYTAAPAATRYETWLANNFPTLLTGQYVGDVDGDGMEPQVEYAYGLNPTTYDASSNFSTVLAPAALGATDLTITFRRDTAATDVTYKLQTSSSLAPNSWTTIAQSAAGAAPVGQNGGVIVSDVTLAGTIKLVTARQTLPAGSNDKKFVRLQVDRF